MLERISEFIGGEPFLVLFLNEIRGKIDVLYCRHMFIECVPLEAELGDVAPVYFKASIYLFVSPFQITHWVMTIQQFLASKQ